MTRLRCRLRRRRRLRQRLLINLPQQQQEQQQQQQHNNRGRAAQKQRSHNLLGFSTGAQAKGGAGGECPKAGRDFFPHNALCVRHAARIRVPLSGPRLLLCAPLPPPALSRSGPQLSTGSRQQAEGSQVILNKHIFQASQRKHFLFFFLLFFATPSPLLRATPLKKRTNTKFAFGLWR